MRCHIHCMTFKFRFNIALQFYMIKLFDTFWWIFTILYSENHKMESITKRVFFGAVTGKGKHWKERGKICLLKTCPLNSTLGQDWIPWQEFLTYSKKYQYFPQNGRASFINDRPTVLFVKALNNFANNMFLSRTNILLFHEFHGNLSPQLFCLLVFS